MDVIEHEIPSIITVCLWRICQGYDGYVLFGEFVKAIMDMFCLENMSRLWRICSVSPSHNEVILSFCMTIFDKISTTNVKSGAGTAYPSGSPEFTPRAVWGSICLGNDHLTWRGGGGLCFFSKKIFWFPMLLKKIFWFWWRKKKIIWVFVI